MATPQRLQELARQHLHWGHKGQRLHHGQGDTNLLEWKCYSNLETMNIQVSGSGGSSGYSGAGTWQKNINFPNFDNQFEGV